VQHVEQRGVGWCGSSPHMSHRPAHGSCMAGLTVSGWYPIDVYSGMAHASTTVSFQCTMYWRWVRWRLERDGWSLVPLMCVTLSCQPKRKSRRVSFQSAAVCVLGRCRINVVYISCRLRGVCVIRRSLMSPPGTTGASLCCINVGGGVAGEGGRAWGGLEL
jgi:hypothetical protein